MTRNEMPLPGEPLNGLPPEAEAHLLGQLRDGDVEAGHCFVREYYPPVYRYLLYLSGHRETAEDLTQETFLQAWRHLDQFQGRAPLRLWLHTIARREFLRARRCRRVVTSLEEAAELSEPHPATWTDEAELRVLLNKLPEEQQEVIALHYLGGYSSSEIAQIVQAPARTVRYRLGVARTYLAQALGSGDLPYVNETAVPMRQWEWLPLEQMRALEARLARAGVGCWVLGAGTESARPNTQHPTPNTGSEATEEDPMERREFLRHAAVGAAGLMLPEAELEVVDRRLTQKVTLAFKGTAISDLCEHLRAATGIHLAAGNSVADEKVTIFCEKLPLREVMRQLSRPFGYTWLRGGSLPSPPNVGGERGGSYHYELVQDLRGQLLEEELRNRDRNAALLALEAEIERFRPHLSLSPDEALAKAKTAPPAEKTLLEHLAGPGWGPIQMYFRLSPQQQAALRAGQELWFSQEPKPGESSLPDEIARGVLQARRDVGILRESGLHQEGSGEPTGPLPRLAGPDEPGALPPSAVPEAQAVVTLWLHQTELGRFGFGGCSEIRLGSCYQGWDTGPYAAGLSPTVLQPRNAALHAKLARDPSLQRHVTVRPAGPNPPAPFPGREGGAELVTPGRTNRLPSPSRGGAGGGVTSADVLEALHLATGLPIIADFYTRLYAPEVVSVKDQPIFEALCRLADAMRLRWNRESGWLQFRSTSYYDDRLKEVPNRLLARWTASRRQCGAPTFDDLCEIAELSDVQLEAADMAQGARECWGLWEWDLPCGRPQRPHLRFLARLTPAQRQEATSEGGLPFRHLSLAQQQQFVALITNKRSPSLRSLEELAGAAVRVAYTQPDGFQVEVPKGPGGIWRKPAELWLVWEPTRETALQTAHRLNPEVEPAEIVPTELAVTIMYTVKSDRTGASRAMVRATPRGCVAW